MQTVPDKTRVQRESLYIGLLGFLLFTLGVWDQPFVGFETRFALFAQEMWRHGPSLFPTTYGAPYPDYPAASTFLIWLCSLPFKGVFRFSAVLPTATASALSLAFSYRLLAPFSRRWAYATVCFELLTLHFLAEARSISLDQMVATITLLCFYLAFTDARQTRSLPILLSVLLVMGFAIRGPLGIVIPAGVVCNYYLFSAQWKKLWQFAVIAVCLLLICWLGLLALTTHIYGPEFRDEVIRMQVSGRLDLGEKASRWIYFTSSFGNYAPSYPIAVLTTALLLVTRVDRLRKPLGHDLDSLLIYFVGWTLVVLVGLSIPDTKKVRYLLPMVPAISALAAYPFFEGKPRHAQPLWTLLRQALEKVLLMLPTLALVLLWKFRQYVYQLGIPVSLHFLPLALLLLATQIVSFVLHLTSQPRTKSISVLAAAVGTLWLLNVLAVEPGMQHIHDTQRFVGEVEMLRQQHDGQIAFFHIGKDAAAIKYLVNLDYDVQPQFLNTATDIDALSHRDAFYLILPNEALPSIQTAARLQHEIPVLRDHFDHDDYTVYYLPVKR